MIRHIRKRRRNAPSYNRKAIPGMQFFIDALRDCLDLDPLYDRSERSATVAERFMREEVPW